jgi:hypothetical protein
MADKSNEGTAGVETTEKITKTEAVKRSMQKLGKQAMPKAIQADVKARFGLDITPDYAGKVKADLLARAKAGKKPATREQAPPAEKPAPPAVGKNGKAPAVLMDDILKVKDLVERVGAAHLRTLIAAFES